jgi:hypothetical protein
MRRRNPIKCAYLVCLIQCLTTRFLLSQSNPVPLINHMASVVSPISASQPDPEAQAKILDSYGKLPLSFAANHGQTDERVTFLSRTGGYLRFLTGNTRKPKHLDTVFISLTGWSAI